MAKKLGGGQYIVGPPDLKVGGTSLARSLRLLRLCSAFEWKAIMLRHQTIH